jgi:hypothetical protein
MKSKGHLFYNMIIFVMLWLAFEEIQLSAILLPITISTFPDVDLHFGSHRHVVFHSVIPWLIVCVFNFNMICTLAMLSIGLHLLLDITPKRKKWRGFYTLKIWSNKPFFFFVKRKRGYLTTLWLFSNFGVSVAILTLKLIYL